RHLRRTPPPPAPPPRHPDLSPRPVCRDDRPTSSRKEPPPRAPSSSDSAHARVTTAVLPSRHRRISRPAAVDPALDEPTFVVSHDPLPDCMAPAAASTDAGERPQIPPVDGPGVKLVAALPSLRCLRACSPFAPCIRGCSPRPGTVWILKLVGAVCSRLAPRRDDGHACVARRRTSGGSSKRATRSRQARSATPHRLRRLVLVDFRVSATDRGSRTERETSGPCWESGLLAAVGAGLSEGRRGSSSSAEEGT